MGKGDTQVNCTLAVTSKPWKKDNCTSHLSHSGAVSYLNSFYGKNELEAHWLRYSDEKMCIEPVKWMKYMMFTAHCNLEGDG